MSSSLLPGVKTTDFHSFNQLKESFSFLKSCWSIRIKLITVFLTFEGSIQTLLAFVSLLGLCCPDGNYSLWPPSGLIVLAGWTECERVQSELFGLFACQRVADLLREPQSTGEEDNYCCSLPEATQALIWLKNGIPPPPNA